MKRSPGSLPVVALLVGREPQERYSIHRGYVDAVTAVGALPVMVPTGPGIDPRTVARWVARCDAVVLTGGGDVAPSSYAAGPGRKLPDVGLPDVGLMDVDVHRDQVELEAIRQAMDSGKRVLGICRGVQVLAVAAGGSLIADVVSAGYDSHWDEQRQYEPVHGIKAEAGSLAEMALAAAATVNSIHHQAVADPGALLRASAWAPDGLIEAIEGPNVLGVQWHPERLIGGFPQHLAAFRWVVDR